MARETINGLSMPVPGTGEPADFQGELRAIAQGLPDAYARGAYLAVGDGVADDAPRIQAALDRFPAGTVTLGAGTWKISSAVKIPAGGTLAGVAGTVLNGGAVPIANDGTIRDLAIGTGWTDSGGGQAAVIGGRAVRVTRSASSGEVFALRGINPRLPRAISTLIDPTAAAFDLNVLILGDSIGEGSGASNAWFELLFDSTLAGGDGAGVYLATVFGTTLPAYPGKLSNGAVGGSTAHLVTAHVAIEESPPPTGGAGVFAAQLKEGERPIGLPPALRGTWDLVFICVGANGGDDWEWHLENAVASLRKAGSDVILITQNPRSDNAAFLAAQVRTLRRIATAYGCGVADTHTAIRLEILTGRAANAAAFLADTVHPNQDGHKLYARVIRDLLLEARSNADRDPAPLPSRRVVHKANSTAVLQSAAACYYGAQFTATSMSGGVTMATPTAGANDPTGPRNPLTGRRADLTNVMFVIPAGESVDFAVPEGIDLTIVGVGSGVAGSAFDVRVQNGATTLAGGDELGSASIAGRIFTHHLNSGAYSGHAGTHRTIRILGTVGTTQILGVIYNRPPARYHPRDSTGKIAGVTYTGTWVQHAPSYGVITQYTDTVNDFFEVDFVGDGVLFHTADAQGGGILRISVDGRVLGDVDTYRNIGAPGLRGHAYRGFGPGRHRLRVQLIGANGAAAAPSNGSRRLMLYDLASVDNRQNAPLDAHAGPPTVLAAP